ncbi:ankyrin repeat domain-containing protein, partial [Candidatus Micrarchaeota archaeon]|nr:ankyrin repeat domain-containing protein [Candidatus Micrarchaeota archaeon]
MRKTVQNKDDTKGVIRGKIGGLPEVDRLVGSKKDDLLVAAIREVLLDKKLKPLAAAIESLISFGNYADAEKECEEYGLGENVKNLIAGLAAKKSLLEARHDSADEILSTYNLDKKKFIGEALCLCVLQGESKAAKKIAALYDAALPVMPSEDSEEYAAFVARARESEGKLNKAMEETAQFRIKNYLPDTGKSVQKLEISDEWIKKAALDSDFTLAAGKGDIKKVKMLFSKGADLNAPSSNGFTPLMWAVLGKHVEVIEFLVEKGADVNAPSIHGLTALMTAARNGDIETVRLLKENGADADVASKSGLTAWMFAAYNGHME